MDTQFKRFTLRLSSQPLQLGGQYRLSFKALASRCSFENLSRDDYHFSDHAPRTTSTIRHPVRTTDYDFSLSDQIQWNGVFSSHVGIHYDHIEMTPRQLNVDRHVCDKIPPVLNTYSG